MDNRFGLKTHCIEAIIKVLSLHKEVEEALIFGSRAMGTYKNGSDIDLALKGKDINFDTIAAIRLHLAELPYIYMYDIIDYKKISNPAVTAHIDELGISFFKKEEIMSEWKTFKLGEFISHKKGYAFKSSLYKKKGCPIIRVSNFTNNSIDFKDILFIDTQEKNNFSDVELKENNIVIATVGSWPNNPASVVGRVIKVPKVANGSLLNQNAVIIYPNEKVDNIFLYYLLKENKFSNYLVSGAQGSASQASIKLEQIYNYEIIIPSSLETQSQIAQILTALDDKIELNLQMNQTLEAMAQAIFKEWFVDFNFPGFDGVLVDGLPKGWRMGKLEEIVNVKGGTTPSTTKEEFWNGEYYWTTPKDLSNNQSPVLIDTERKITDLGVKQIGSGIMPKGTLLLSSRAPIGYIAISQVPISINQGYIAIQGKLVSNLFMLFWLKQNMGAVKSKANGSTFQEISKTNFREIDTIIPTNEILVKFDKIVKPIFEKIVENVFQNQTLTATRDTLLPKLMSGKIAIKR